MNFRSSLLMNNADITFCGEFSFFSGKSKRFLRIIRWLGRQLLRYIRLSWHLPEHADGSGEFCGEMPLPSCISLSQLVLQNASWIINSLKVYKQSLLPGGASSATRTHPIITLEMTGWIFSIGVFLHIVIDSLWDAGCSSRDRTNYLTNYWPEAHDNHTTNNPRICR